MLTGLRDEIGIGMDRTGLDRVGDWEYVRYAPADINGQRTTAKNSHTGSGERRGEGRGGEGREGGVKEQKGKTWQRGLQDRQDCSEMKRNSAFDY